MTYIRTLFADKAFCPFYFQFDFARVMSGEEEAVYAWTASNFLFSTLFPVCLACFFSVVSINPSISVFLSLTHSHLVWLTDWLATLPEHFYPHFPSIPNTDIYPYVYICLL